MFREGALKDLFFVGENKRTQASPRTPWFRRSLKWETAFTYVLQAVGESLGVPLMIKGEMSTHTLQGNTAESTSSSRLRAPRGGLHVSMACSETATTPDLHHS